MSITQDCIEKYKAKYGSSFVDREDYIYTLVGIVDMDDGAYFLMQHDYSGELSLHCVLGGLSGANFEEFPYET